MGFGKGPESSAMVEETTGEAGYLKRKVHSLEQLLEISRQVFTLDLRTVLNMIMKHILEMTQTKRGLLMLKNAKGRLQFEFGVNLGREIVEREDFEISRSAAERAMATGDTIIIEDVGSSSFRDRPSVVGLGLMALMVVPLKTEDGILGVIYIDTDSPRHNMSDKDLSIFNAFGAQAALAIQNALSHQNLKQDYFLLKRSLEGSFGFDGIVYQSNAMHRVCQAIKRVLDNDITVLIQGETGTGKELVARAIHFNGKRREWRFVSQNAGALPDTMLESELFGHRRGSFSGAVEHKQGLFEVADGGSVFLDEIGEASPAMQVRLLRFLETGTFRRVGETVDRSTNARIVAASNRDLKQEVDRGRFRQDLYYRLSVYPIVIPPLRERKEDIPLLVRHLVDEYNRKLGKTVTSIPKETMAMLMERDWPGNVRELKNFVYRMMVLSNSDKLTYVAPVDETGLSSPVREDGDDPEPEARMKTLDEVERDHMRRVLAHVDGNQAKAARILGLNRSTFRWRLKKLGIHNEKKG